MMLRLILWSVPSIVVAKSFKGVLRAEAFSSPPRQQTSRCHSRPFCDVSPLQHSAAEQDAGHGPPNLVSQEAFINAIDVLKADMGMEIIPADQRPMYALGKLEAQLPLEQVSGK